jgi:hypothetical protein
MIWLVRLLACDDGSLPDEKYADGVVIEDRREGAFDLVHEANRRWGTQPQPGEIYSIVPAPHARVVKVLRDGTMKVT